MPDLAAALAPLGMAILAGFLQDDERSLDARARQCGMRVVDRRRSRPWSVLAVRPGS